MQMIALVVYYALFVFTLLLTARAILSFVPLLVRGWEPKGLVLVVAETVYTVTDGPLRVVGRLVPPLRIGVVALDMGFLLLFFLVSFAMRLISAFLM